MHRSRGLAAITVAALAVGLAAVGAPGSAHGAGPIPVPVVPPSVPVAPAAPATNGPAHPSPFTDYTTERPGKRVKIVAADLPAPGATRSVDNGPRVVKRPKDAWPQAPAGFNVQLYADGLSKPRLIGRRRTVTCSSSKALTGVVRVFRGLLATGKAAWSGVFAKGFSKPFGVAFYPPGPDPRWLYVANTDSVVRLPYRNGDTAARGPAETVVAELPGGGLLRGGGHWTRDIAFSRDGTRMFVSVGSRTNNDDPDTTPAEKERADVLEFAPDGSGRRVYASGIRNAVGIAVHPVRASCGRRSTSVTSWATTWSPTTSRTSRKAASTAGPGTTSAATRIRATVASILN